MNKERRIHQTAYLKTCDGVFQVKRATEWILNLFVVHLFQNATCTLGTVLNHRLTYSDRCAEAVLWFVFTLTVLVFTLLTCANDVMGYTSCYQ